VTGIKNVKNVFYIYGLIQAAVWLETNCETIWEDVSPRWPQRYAANWKSSIAIPLSFLLSWNFLYFPGLNYVAVIRAYNVGRLSSPFNVAYAFGQSAVTDNDRILDRGHGRTDGQMGDVQRLTRPLQGKLSLKWLLPVSLRSHQLGMLCHLWMASIMSASPQIDRAWDYTEGGWWYLFLGVTKECVNLRSGSRPSDISTVLECLPYVLVVTLSDYHNTLESFAGNSGQHEQHWSPALYSVIHSARPVIPG